MDKFDQGECIFPSRSFPWEGYISSSVKVPNKNLLNGLDEA
jgi:hypothetical protein